MNSSGDRYPSTPEVNHSHLPEVHKAFGSELPEVTGGDFPEVIRPNNYASAVPPTSDAQIEQTILGLRKSTFWIVLVVVIILVLCGAVGGAVGSTQASKSAPSATSTPEPPLNNSSPVTPSLISESKLASVNYTGANGVDHYQVYFQTSTNAIYQSAWNSSVQKWVASPITTKEMLVSSNVDLDVKGHTPIAANIYWHSASQIDFHVFYLDSQNRVQELISTSVNGPWAMGDINNRYTAAASSQLVYYGRECAYCLDVNIVIYEDTSNVLQVAQLLSNGWTQIPIGSSLPTPVTGSALAIAPVFAAQKAHVALYINSVDLQLLLFDGSKWIFSAKLPIVLSQSASIAAFSNGWSITGSQSLNMLALTTNPDSTAGGVSVERWIENSWSGPDNPSTLATVANYSALAANQAGRIYGIVEDNLGPRIVEWAFDNRGGYTRIGNVT